MVYGLFKSAAKIKIINGITPMIIIKALINSANFFLLDFKFVNQYMKFLPKFCLLNYNLRLYYKKI